MVNVNVFFFIFSFLLHSLSYGSDARDRCSIKDCLCKVKTLPSTDNHSSTLTIYFEEDSSSISDKQKEIIRNWSSASNSSYSLWGYADGCGSTNHNHRLVDARLLSVANEIDSPLYTINKGESTFLHKPSERKVVIFLSPSKLALQMANYSTPYWLIDASGSMKPHWKTIKSYPFPKDSNIWLAKTAKCLNDDYLQYIIPEGKTEIWYPIWKVLNLIPPGSTLVVISDFNSTVPLSSSGAEIINNLIKTKNINYVPIAY